MLALFGELQRTAVDQWQRNLRATQDWQRTATDGLAAALTQQAYLQRQGIEHTRALVHMGALSTKAAMQDGDEFVEPTRTAVDTQFDLLRLLQWGSMAALLTATEGAAPADSIEDGAPQGTDATGGPNAELEDDSPAEVDANAEPAPDGAGATTEAPADADADGQAELDESAGEFTELLEQSVPDVKEHVRTEDVAIEQLIEAERAGEARVTLLDWLERRLEASDTE